ncbi:F-box protein At5g07610-like [Tasmannia lanceolata]|uniref:F-box protein At5g07610-like n=1 Tax=Tasmannia lanceolata TaxID=3420 RepID=UPI004062B695
MSFSEDMLIKILARLPAKSLHRFKCVSKEWRNLICKGTLYRKILPPLMSGLFYPSFEPSRYVFVSNLKGANGGDTDMIPLSFLPCHQNIRIANCCNGLLLCWMVESDRYQNQKKIRYIVCNPTTRKWVSLPKVHRIGYVMGLVYNPRISDQFKVVCFMDRICRDATSLELEIFSSETGKWVESRVFLGSEGCLDGLAAVFSDGALHVLLYPHHVLKFDIKEESCRLIELPERLNGIVIGCLGVSCGCLHFAYLDTPEMKIWTLRDCRGSEWELKHGIRFSALLKQPSQPNLWRFNLLAFHPDLDVVFLASQGEILSYHLNSSKLEKLNLDLSPSFRDPYRSMSYLFPFSPCLDTFAN